MATNRLGDLGPGSSFIWTSLIAWYSKKQSTMETLVFGAELCAMKIGVKNLCTIQCKFRMMGITISWSSHVYGDNMLVIHNTSKPELTLKKMFNAIAYHVISKSMAMGELFARHIKSEDNT